MKEKRGITLISLVITVIVLLILAGVAISMALNEGNIFEKANEAKISWNKDVEEEETKLNEVLQILDEMTGGSGGTPAPTPASGTLEIPSGLAIGSTISWTPAGGTYTWEGAYSYGTDDLDQYLASGVAYENLSASDKQIYENMTISSWKVLSIDETNNIVKIVPASSTTANNGPNNGKVDLDDAPGYNNGVKLLNDACSALYGDQAHGITARSINIEDIEEIADPTALATAKSDYDYGSYTRYATQGGTTNRDQTTGAYKTGKNYPAIWAQEEGSYIDGLPTGGTLGLSEQTSFIDCTSPSSNGGVSTATTSIGPKQTKYGIEFETLLDDSKYLSIIYSDYWIASRHVDLSPDFVIFRINYNISGNNYNDDDECVMFSNGSYSYFGRHGLFPVVTLTQGTIVQSGAEYFPDGHP